MFLKRFKGIPSGEHKKRSNGDNEFDEDVIDVCCIEDSI